MIVKNNSDEDFKKETIRIIIKTIIITILLIIAKIFGSGFEEMITIVFGAILLSLKI